MASSLNPAAATSVALLGRNDGARAQLRQSLEELGASIVFEGDAAGTKAGQLFERAPDVVIVNLADGGDDDLDHLQSVLDAPQISVVFNDAEVFGRLQGWDLARWARHLAVKVLGGSDIMPPAPLGSEKLPVHDMLPVPGDRPPTPAQMAPQRAIEEFVVEAEDLADALPEDYLPMSTNRDEPHAHVADTTLGLDQVALQGAMRKTEAIPGAHAEPAVVRFEPAPSDDELPDSIPLPDLGELERALEADAQSLVGAARSERELLDEALGGLDLDFLDPIAPPPAAADTFADFDDTAAADTADFSVLDDDDDAAIDADASPRAPTPLPPASAVLPFGALFLENTTPLPPGRVDTTDADEGFDAQDAAGGAASAMDQWSLTDEIELPPVEPARAAPAFTASEGMSLELERFGEDDDTAAAAPAPVAMDSVECGDDAEDFGFSLETDDGAPTETADLAWSTDHAELQFDEDAGMDDDVAALAAQLDALEQDAPQRVAEQGLDSLTLQDIDFEDDEAAAPRPAPAAAAPALPVRESAREVPSVDLATMDFGALALTSMDEEIATAAPVRDKNFDFSGIGGLSLEPLDDEAAVAVDDVDPLLVAMGLVEATSRAPAHVGIPRVIVLGASIGGPDALRTFLAGIPADFPALFLLVQHLETGYFERLAQQLQKATKLPVRAITSGAANAVAGEVLVIPANARFVVNPDGSIDSSPHAEPPRYTPSIDNVMRDTADLFGARASAIIFSGMAGDAIEGAVYITSKGGEVWAQDPASCVVSSMVDGASARGVVEYIGSPRELAERCVTLYGG